MSSWMSDDRVQELYDLDRYGAEHGHPTSLLPQQTTAIIERMWIAERALKLVIKEYVALSDVYVSEAAAEYSADAELELRGNGRIR